MHNHNEDGRIRVVIENVTPEIDCGRFPAKRVIGDDVLIEADIFTDGHDCISAVLLYRKDDEQDWTETPMQYQLNDRWSASFRVSQPGRYSYTVQAWVDHFETWRQDLVKKNNAGQDVSVELLVGAGLIDAAIDRAVDKDAKILKKYAGSLRSSREPVSERIGVALSEDIAGLMRSYPDRHFSTTYSKEIAIVVDREKARFSTWYEMFPRSCAMEPGRHGTFKDCEARLPYIAYMGFDVLYFPPIHPIGYTFRKGKNNAASASQDDPGSPWAIGAESGGHKSIHPQLGTLEDFNNLLLKAKEYGIEIALDIAFNCTLDHPYVKEHPEWFRWRPDKTIQYAENPPKKYQDIYPLDFDTEDWRALWTELKSVVLFWIEQGIRIFRADNPHTKPFVLWEWLIREVKSEHPDVIFLSEAFTRPRIMYRLAKLGFTQSYTYFAWRNTKWELTQYLNELTQTDVREYFNPNLWPNTPDILTEYLQAGRKAAFMSRLVLAATLSASYGIYGPAFELCENKPKEPGSEEYLDSEKYEIKHRDIDNPDSLKDFIAQVNRIRKENTALWNNQSLVFHDVDNDNLICYSKHNENFSNIIVVVVNLDPHHTHSGWVQIPLEQLGIDARRPYQAHDLLDGSRYLWYGHRNYVELDPHTSPAHIFCVRRHVRTEHDFDYFM
jgi:starch synthase (maltosyl-transferring)